MSSLAVREPLEVRELSLPQSPQEFPAHCDDSSRHACPSRGPATLVLNHSWHSGSQRGTDAPWASCTPHLNVTPLPESQSRTWTSGGLRTLLGKGGPVLKSDQQSRFLFMCQKTPNLLCRVITRQLGQGLRRDRRGKPREQGWFLSTTLCNLQKSPCTELEPWGQPPWPSDWPYSNSKQFQNPLAAGTLVQGPGLTALGRNMASALQGTGPSPQGTKGRGFCTVGEAPLLDCLKARVLCHHASG